MRASVRSNMLKTALILLGMLLLAGCGGGGGGGTGGFTFFSVMGFVVDAGRYTGVVGATVSAQGQTVYSDGEGFFRLDNLQGSQVTLELSAGNYQPRSLPVNATGSLVNAGEVTLEPQRVPGTGLVTGQVTLNNFPSAFATVSAEEGARWCRADGSGNYRFYNLPAGEVLLTAASADRTAVNWRTVTVPADGTLAGTNINMTSGPPPLPDF